jgi:NADP-dependent 3-hydroxy acid dehydrogenase YdfG
MSMARLSFPGPDARSFTVRAAGRRCLSTSADLLDHPSLVSAADAVFAEWGRIDVLVNNAGAALGGTFVAQAADDVGRLVALNTTAVTSHSVALAGLVLIGVSIVLFVWFVRYITAVVMSH